MTLRLHSEMGECREDAKGDGAALRARPGDLWRRRALGADVSFLNSLSKEADRL